MADLISRNALINDLSYSAPELFFDKDYLMTKIARQPAVDAVPVVRCRECRYWREEVSPTEHWVCAHHSFNERKMYTTPIFFCADGERRGGNATD